MAFSAGSAPPMPLPADVLPYADTGDLVENLPLSVLAQRRWRAECRCATSQLPLAG